MSIMQPKKKPHEFDPSFYQLAKEITAALEFNKDGSTQQQRVTELMALEIQFRETILKYKQSTEIYKKFLQKICVQNNNILSARPYFREKAKKFSKEITPAIKANDLEKLKTFHINYLLIKFIRDNWLGPFPKKAEALFQKVYKARNQLIEVNMPLAVNRSRLFYRKTPRSHLTLMDMIGLSSLGLISGVDKWVGPYSRMFAGVCIGRITGVLIDLYSETCLHFYPSHRRILYKANSIRGRQGIKDIVELTAAVNKAFEEDAKTGKTVPPPVDVSTLNDLMNAASPVSADGSPNEEGYGVYDFTADSSQNAEERIIQLESTVKMIGEAKELPLLHRKILKLKGVKL
jgi:hypothetical protein